jgi:bifunctional UDP-N-acetylglucosamine pyrophosphorylase/glucosamine-1-phosphate N-acetyltransferase
MMKLDVIILAAGQGTRMRSSLPKVLHPLGGKALVQHVIDTAAGFSDSSIHVVYGHGAEMVLNQLGDQDVNWVMQEEQLGTGHAVQQAMPHIGDDSVVMILYGDVPLIRKETLEGLLGIVAEDTLALLTIELQDSTGYGRIVRNAKGDVERIVEHKDATEEEREIKEINTGILAATSRNMENWLGRLDNNNSQKEYYLTDIIEMAVQDGIGVKTVSPEEEIEVMGINDKVQLAEMERAFQLNKAEDLMRAGVMIMDPARIDIRGDLKAGQDSSLDVNLVAEGTNQLGDRVKVGPNVVLKNAVIGDDVEILSNCVIEDATIGKGSRIGPFARIRPETNLVENAHVGNFVEIKKSTVGKGSKINHLSYIGDSIIGSGVNIGAGTITCNYDGANKHQTIIGDDAFIGSDTQLVAPVSVGKGATIGAGSTITRDTPDNQLTLSRSKQISLENWKRPVKEKK